MNMASWIHKVRRVLEDHSWDVALGKVAMRLLAPIYESTVYRIYRMDLQKRLAAADSQQQIAEEDVFEFQVVGAQDTAQITEVENYAEWMRGEVAAKIAAGSLCLVAKQDEDQAGFNFVSSGTVHIPKLRLNRTFAPDCAWSEHIVVHRQFRRRGLATQLRMRMFHELARRGHKRLYGGAETWNTPSLSLARHLGFREIADIRFRRILGIKFWTVRRVRLSVVS